MLASAPVTDPRSAQVTDAGAMPPSLNTPATLAALAAAALFSAGCTGSTVNLGEATPHPYHFSDVRPVSELGTPANDNPTLTSDLLEIFFTSNRDNASTDVWTARRASPADPFGTVTLVSEASSPSFETSSAISSDGLTLWFGSDRLGGLGGLDIWVTQRSTPRRRLVGARRSRRSSTRRRSICRARWDCTTW